MMPKNGAKNGVGAWEFWNVREKEKAEIGNVDKIY